MEDFSVQHKYSVNLFSNLLFLNIDTSEGWLHVFLGSYWVATEQKTGVSGKGAEYIICYLLCPLPGRRPGIAGGDERTRLGRVHLYFFLIFTKYSFLGYYRPLLLEVTMPKTEATN